VGKFIYNGNGLVVPTLGLTLADGDVFEAPDDFTAYGVTSTTKKVTVTSAADPVSPADAIVDAPVADATPDASEAPVEAPAEIPTETAPAATN
jgi:hypothetical protein